jgi:hypothetical protein
MRSMSDGGSNDQPLEKELFETTLSPKLSNINF